jgi:glycosyltransferase involved in cell wall biosynthesis
MKFSVIIPLYNKAPYIRKALESVLAQTYTDYEVIVVDDGSTDDSCAIADEFVREAMGNGLWAIDEENNRQSPIANRLMLLKQQNAGVSAARNNGVAQASGEYIAFLDADDWWEPTYLERMARLIDDYPKAGLYACNYVYYKPGKTHVALNIPTGYINYPKAYYEGGAMPVTSISVAVPRKVFEEVGGFPLGIKLGEDFLLWSKIAMQYKVAFLNEPLAWYNNDVPATLRATRNLHAPEHHMLFNMKELIDESLRIKGEEISRADTNAYNLSLITYKPTNDDWRRLIDKLRVNGLLDYWLDKRYHDQAIEELKKVDWSNQPDSVKRIYKTPIWILKLKKLIMRWGSLFKQKIIKIIHR